MWSGRSGWFLNSLTPTRSQVFCGSYQCVQTDNAHLVQACSYGGHSCLLCSFTSESFARLFSGGASRYAFGRRTKQRGRAPFLLFVCGTCNDSLVLTPIILIPPILTHHSVFLPQYQIHETAQQKLSDSLYPSGLSFE